MSRHSPPSKRKESKVYCQVCNGEVVSEINVSPIIFPQASNLTESRLRLCDDCHQKSREFLLKSGNASMSEDDEDAKIRQLEIQIKHLERVFNNQVSWLKSVGDSTSNIKKEQETKKEQVKEWLKFTKSFGGVEGGEDDDDKVDEDKRS